MAIPKMDEKEVERLSKALKAVGLSVTAQRLEIANAFVGKCVHLSADQILGMVNGSGREVSKATIYNTLKVFVEKGLLKEVVVDPTRIYYDSNVSHHHHFYDAATGTLTDIPVGEIRIEGLSAWLDKSPCEAVEIIVRTRRPV